MSKPLQELFDLSGRVAIVTGASRGLGFQIAQALGEYGAQLALVARKPQDLEEAAARLREQGISATPFVADLSDRDAAQDLLSSVRARVGEVDILVNNAGATWGAPAEEHPLEGWDKVINVNLSALFRLTQLVARDCLLPRGKGSIVNIASIEGLMGHHWSRPGTVSYNASKGAVVNMTRSLAAEWGRRGVRVNAIAPGYFPSKMTHAVLDAHGRDLIEQTPLGKLGSDNDLKGLALLLASDAGGHLTGQVIAVDGGFTII